MEELWLCFYGNRPIGEGENELCSGSVYIYIYSTVAHID